jgi:hypothetical protein
VWFPCSDSRIVRVLGMRVVRVEMLMLHRLVPVVVFVPLRPMQPDAQPHEKGRHPDAHRERVAGELAIRAPKRCFGHLATGRKAALTCRAMQDLLALLAYTA